MVRFSNLIIILIVILNVHIIHSTDILNITQETINLGQKFVHEVEEKNTYRNFDDVMKKLEKINKIFLTHGKKILRNKVMITKLVNYVLHTIWYGVEKEIYDIKDGTISYNPFFDLNENRDYPVRTIITFLNKTQTQTLNAESLFDYMKKVFLTYSDKLKENILNLNTKPSVNEKMNKLHKLLQTTDVESKENFLNVLSGFPVGN